MIRPARLLAAGILIATFGCDKVEPPYLESSCGDANYVFPDVAIIGPYTLTFGPDTLAAVKKVLLEDYTGHTCGNCPAAGQYIVNTLVPANPDRLVVMGVHAGDFAKPTGSQPNQPAGSFQTDFRCQTGNEWNDKFGVNFNPCGMVDRTGFPDQSHLLPYLAWSSVIQNQLALPAEAKIRILAEYDPPSGTIYIAVQTVAMQAFNRELKLQVVVTEDSVIDWQTWYGHTPEYEPAYAHRHVLRGAANGDFGETVYSGAVAAGTKTIRGCCFQTKPEMDIRHASVVAFLYDAETEEVVQAEEIHIEE
ncbi:MAG: hypothetical protein RL213_1411 [Bacteroidota bacterium]|jgi:hypothetical protein